MRATYRGKLLAESDDTVVVEGSHYFPRASLVAARFRESEHHTRCPWKGEASYLDVVTEAEGGGGGAADVNANAAWYYPAPKPAAAEIVDRVAFWKGVDVTP